MGLIDRLRKAEEQGKQATRSALDRARELGEDVERRIRQKMRIYPPHAAKDGSGAMPSAGAASRRSAIPDQTKEAPIVSLHGEDLEADKVA